MSTDAFPVGLVAEVSYPQFQVRLTLLSAAQLKFEIDHGPFARAEVVDIEVVALGNGIFVVSWQEKSGATVTNIHDYDRGHVHSFATLSDGQFLRMAGPLRVIHAPGALDHVPTTNKARVLEAMTSLFRTRDAAAVDRLYAPGYIQHNPDIPQGRDALRRVVEQLREDVHYEPGLIIAEGNLVAIHGRIRGWAAVPQVVVDIFRIEDGKLAEHWDVLQEEAAPDATRKAVSMFDPAERERVQG